MRQAVVCQMTFAGAPMIYYGDEAGMWGPDDPSDRQPMVWKDLQPYDDPQVTFDDEQFALYQRAIAIRRALPALQTGYFHTVAADDSSGTLAYARTLDDQAVYILLNRSDQPRTIRIPIDSSTSEKWINYMDPSSTTITEIPDRPTITIRPDTHTLTPVNGAITMTLDPYTSAILAPQK
jgi:glycosidase